MRLNTVIRLMGRYNSIKTCNIPGIECYSADISAAWKVVGKMNELGWHFEFSFDLAKISEAMFLKIKENEFYGVGCDGKLYEPPIGKSQNKSAPLAICRAALLTVMED